MHSFIQCSCSGTGQAECQFWYQHTKQVWLHNSSLWLPRRAFACPRAAPIAVGDSAPIVYEDGQTAFDLALAGNHHDVCRILLMRMGSAEPPPIISETKHSPLTDQIQYQTHQVWTRSTTSHPSIEQFCEALHHTFSPAGTFKHWEDDGEKEIIDIIRWMMTSVIEK